MNESIQAKASVPLWGLLVLLFGVLSQYLLVDRSPGISVAVLLLAYYGLLFFFTQGRSETGKGFLLRPWQLWLPLAAALLLALSYTLFANSVFRVLNVPVLAALLVYHSLLLRQDGFLHKKGSKWLTALLYAGIGAPIRRLLVPAQLIGKRIRFGKKENTSASQARKLLLGLALALPVLLFVLMLLASADPVFDSWLSAFPEWLGRLSLGEGVGRSVFALVIAWYLFCFFWGLVLEKRTASLDPEAEHADGQKTKQGQKGTLFEEEAHLHDGLGIPKLDPLVAAGFLGAVNVLYLLFAIVQFAYLFGGAQGLLPEGVVYADYARQGFAELVLVAAINLTILLAGFKVIAPGSPVMDRVRRLLFGLLVLCTLVMLISAYTRLSLYEDAYGYTMLRLLVHGFMLYLGVFFLLALARIWRERLELSKLFAVTTLLACLVMTYANLDERIARNNTDRYERTGKIDAAYLGGLSSDAYPVLSKFQAEHPEIEGLLQAVHEIKQRAQAATHQGWPSWNYSHWKAAKGGTDG
ncbi:DUF4173 domain-containing protein [Gorillibacterium sp. CAU 1737]|uniref:DUF4153 domain-containing protein n=1 Tax=Gorillibacterium sp. CAU 1737 TaxID=3140362 RepID=UPI003261C5DC